MRLQYNGKDRINELGLEWNDYAARYYAAWLGRWMGVDDLSDEPEQIDKAVYAYVWNDPIKLDDPDGNCPLALSVAVRYLK